MRLQRPSVEFGTAVVGPVCDVNSGPLRASRIGPVKKMQPASWWACIVVWRGHVRISVCSLVCQGRSSYGKRRVMLPRYKCHSCDKSFSLSSNLQKHERGMHSIVRPHSCSYCEKQFMTVGDLKRHVRIHTGTKLFSCRHCSEFMWPTQLETHLLKSHSEGTWFTCLICRKKFSQKGKQHMQRHHDMKVWSRMFAMNVQSSCIQQVNWNDISKFILSTDSSAVSCAMHSSNVISSM